MKKIVLNVFLCFIFILSFNISTYAQELSIKDIKEFENINEETSLKIDEVLDSIDIKEIKNIEIKTNESLTIYRFETNHLPINIYIKDNSLEKITLDISSEYIEFKETEYLLFDGEIKDCKDLINVLENIENLNEKNLKLNEKTSKMTKLTYLGFGLSGFFILVIIILIIKLNKYSEIKYIYNSLCDKHNELTEQYKELQENNKILQNELSKTKEYSDKLTKCIAKLNKDLTEQKIINENTLNNFTQMHEQDLISIGNSHQKEIAIIKEDYESKIKELEENNKGLQKAITKINKE